MHRYFRVRGLATEADDLTQKTLERYVVWQDAHPGEEPPPNLEGFLNANAEFVRLQHYRDLGRDRARTAVTTDIAALQDGRLLASATSLTGEAVGSACSAALELAIAELGVLQREVLLALYLDEHTVGHIAALRGVTKDAVWATSRRALAAFRASPLLTPYDPSRREGGAQ